MSGLARRQCEPVLIIHGTFAQDGDWFRRQSKFCNALNEQLIKHGSAAERWSHCPTMASNFAGLEQIPN